MMGIVLDRPFPTFPHGFPADVIAEFERRIGRGTLGNVVASGTEIIDRLGAEHMRTGKPIVYTSADSVFQIAAHEDVIPIAEQYRICEIAFDLVGRGMGVGRVIARPFVGAPGAFTRTANRHDYALEPTGETLLDLLTARRHPGHRDRQDERSVCRPRHQRSMPTSQRRPRAWTRSLEAMTRDAGRPDLRQPRRLRHAVRPSQRRRRLRRQPRALRRAARARVLAGCATSDLLVVTADHGNDPTTPSTDHSREYVPLLLTGARVRAGVDLGTRATFADLGQTLADNFGVGPLAHGTSFLRMRRSLSSIREALEQRERETLAPQAAKSADSRGRLRPEPEDDVRPAFQHDRDRIIHSKAFRRLKHKTQVFFAPAGDHYRTRLTHTLEVSQIARTIAKVLRLHEELTEVDRARPRPRPHAVRPRRRARARLADARRLPPLRAEPAHRRRARERRPRPEPDVGGARRHRPPLEGQERARRSASIRRSARRRSKGRSCASPTSSPTSITTSTMRCGRGC